MSETHKRMLGGTLIPLNSIIYRGDDPLDLASLTVKFVMEGETNGTVKVAESTTGVTAHPTQAFTLDATNNWFACNAHGVKNEDQIVPTTAGNFTSSGITASQRYFARDVTPNNFRVALVPNGQAVDITGAGTGAHSFYIVGSVQKVFLAADVDTAGRYSAWWTVVSGSDFAAAPVERQGLVVEVIAFGN
jgi:hypothetical protein